MITKCQTFLIRWLLEPLYRAKRHIPDKIWSGVISLSVLGIILVQFLDASGKSPRYLYIFAPFCLFLGLIILSGLSEGMKPVAFSKVLLGCWYGVTACMVISGIFVDSNVLADAVLWMLAFPVFFVVWGNRPLSDLVRPLMDGVYLSFGIFFLICLYDYPIKGIVYQSFFLNPNGLAMYVTAVAVTAVADIVAQKRFCPRMVVADVILGLSAAISFYTSSRAGQAVLLISGGCTAVLFLLVRREKLWKKLLCHVLPAVLAMVILIPNTGYIINAANKIIYEKIKKDHTVVAPVEAPPVNPAEVESTWDSITRYNEERRKQGMEDGFDAFSTGRLELWKVYLKETGFLGNPADKVLHDSTGNVVKKSAHNTLIQMAYEFGILASVCFLIFNVFSGMKALIYAIRERAVDYTVFPLAVALAYGAYYMVEKIMYPPVSLVLCLYLLSQVAMMPKWKKTETVSQNAA